MKRYITLLLVCASLSCLFWGCPYNSQVGLGDKPAVKVDNRLIGKWEEKSSSDNICTVTKSDDYTAKIVKKSGSSEPVIYTAFISVIDSTTFLNVVDNESGNPSYYFFKMEMTDSGSKLTLTPVTDNISEKFSTVSEQRSFFQKYKSLSFFYDKDSEVYIKAD